MTVKIKYCGGCNPRYDREAFFRRLAETFPEIIFQSNPEEGPCAGLVICGCDAACADASNCIGSSGRVTVWREDAFESVCRFLKEISEKQDKESEDK
jgi:4-hydroxybutyrate CoA-transferase